MYIREQTGKFRYSRHARVSGRYDTPPRAGDPGLLSRQMAYDYSFYRQLICQYSATNKAGVFPKGELIDGFILVELQTKKPLAKCQELFNF